MSMVARHSKVASRRYPEPALDFDFTRCAINDAVLGLVPTVTGGANGTRVNESGLIVAANAPRFDFDPLTGVCKGLLIEEQRTNLLTESEFRNGLTDAPVRQNVTATAFAGVAAATGIAFGTAGVDAYAYKTNFVVTAGVAYILSALVRMDDGFAPAFGNATGTHASNDFVLAVGGSGVPPTTYVITDFGGGLYRVSGSYVATTTLANVGIVKYSTNTARTFKVSGYDLEVGATVSSYIPTMNTQVTRTADAVSLATAAWLNAAEGTFAATFATPVTPAVSTGIAGTAATSRFLYIGTGSHQIGSYDGATLLQAPQVVDNGVPHKVASSYGGGGRSVVVDGAAAATGALAAGYASGSPMSIGAYTPGGQPLNGHIRRLRYWPTRLPDATLQALTA